MSYCEAMKEENKVAIGKTVMGNKETMLTIIPTAEGMLIETMYFADEIKDLPKEVARPETNPAELEMAKTLIGTMTKEFEPELYKDEYQERLKELIEKKIAGQEIVAAKPEGQDNVIDLMEALQKSVEQNKPKKKTTRKTKGA